MEARRLYRVRFMDKDEKVAVTVVAQKVEVSQFFGHIAISGFVFDDRKRHIILPDEDNVRKRFSKTKRLHIPYHNVIFVEEFNEELPNLKKLPFIKEIANNQPIDTHRSE